MQFPFAGSWFLGGALSALLAASWAIQPRQSPGEVHARGDISDGEPRRLSLSDEALARVAGEDLSRMRSANVPRVAHTTRSASRLTSEVASDPLRAPLCADVVLTTVSELGDPDASLATLRSSDDASSRARRFRGSIGRRRVVYVGENPLEHRPAVWLTDGPALCQVLLGRSPPPAVPSSSRNAAATNGVPRGRVTKPSPPPRDFARLVERVDEDTYRVDRSLLDLAVSSGPELAGALRGVGGRLSAGGYVLSRVPPRSLPALLGFAMGDEIVAIGGRPLSGLEAILRAHAELARSPRVTLTVVRGGVKREVVYEVR